MNNILERKRFDKTQHVLNRFLREQLSSSLGGFRCEGALVLGDNIQVLSALMRAECDNIKCRAKQLGVKPDYSSIKTIEGYGLGANELNENLRLYDGFDNAIYSSWETQDNQDYAHTIVLSCNSQKIYDIVPDVFCANNEAATLPQDVDYYAVPKMKIDLSVHNNKAPYSIENMDFALQDNMDEDIFMVQSIINNAVKTEYRKTLLESIKGKHYEQSIEQ